MNVAIADGDILGLTVITIGHDTHVVVINAAVINDDVAGGIDPNAGAIAGGISRIG